MQDQDQYYHGDRQRKNKVRGVNESSTDLWERPPGESLEGAVDQYQRQEDRPTKPRPNNQRGPADGPTRATPGITKAVENLLDSIFK